jgi:hypothetical protein
LYLATLTRPDSTTNDETFDAEREGLEGMAAAQARANREADLDPASPYLRVIVANAGQEAQHAADTVDLLRGLAHDDPTLIGVVASVDSRTRPQRALKALNDLGLPIITPTTSADGIGNGLDLYLQIAAPNVDQARMVRHYVTETLGKQDLVNYYTAGTGEKANEDDDLYVKTLRADLEHEFPGHYQDKFYQPGASVTDICSDVFGGAVFFGGRYTEFHRFIERVYSDCNGKLPVVIADDSVSRYMVNRDARKTAPTNLPLAFVAKGALASCSRLAHATDAERRNFLTDITDVLTRCGNESVDDPVGGWSALTYDATRVLLRATKNLVGQLPPSNKQPWDPSKVTRTAVYNEARRWTDRNPYQGVTGYLEFDAHGVAHNKYQSLLCSPNIHDAYRTIADIPYEVDQEGAVYSGELKPDGRSCGQR